MRKHVGAWALAAEISWVCGNFQLAALNYSSISFICYVKLKYYVNLNYITQIVHSNAHFDPFQGVFSDKLVMNVEILSFQFAEVFNSEET